MLCLCGDERGDVQWPDENKGESLLSSLQAAPANILMCSQSVWEILFSVSSSTLKTNGTIGNIVVYCTFPITSKLLPLSSVAQHN